MILIKEELISNPSERNSIVGGDDFDSWPFESDRMNPNVMILIPVQNELECDYHDSRR